jgi:hypothetical protein
MIQHRILSKAQFPKILEIEILKKLPSTVEEANKIIDTITEKDLYQYSVKLGYNIDSRAFFHNIKLYDKISKKSFIGAPPEQYRGLTPEDIRKMKPKQVYFLVFIEMLLKD